MYQEQTSLDAENFAGFSFPQNDDINASLPIDTIIPQAPPTDARAATDLYETIATLIEDLQKFQETLNLIHNLLTSERFPSPEITKRRLAELQDQLTKMTELAVTSGVAALNSDTDNVGGNTLWMNLGGLGHGGEDQINVNRTFQKMEGMKKSANAVVSVLKKPNARES